MPRFSGNSGFEHGRKHRTGVLLCNVGTPDAPTTSAVRRYLAEFLSDPRIVELPRILWLPILYGFILATRPRRSARAYAAIWTAEGSPLLTNSERLTAALEQSFATKHGDDLIVALGMRYGKPSIASAFDQLLADDAKRVLVVPLYPQYAAATTASVYDAVLARCRKLRWIPELRFIADYHADERYIDAVSRSITEFWSKHGRSERLLLSFHGIPRDYFLAGDPYHCQCQATARLVAERLGVELDAWAISFQSRIGPRRWLEPYTDDKLREWAGDGVKTVDVVCPGFSVDCLETLEEIAMGSAASFRAAGGTELRYIPALNDSSAHVAVLEDVISQHLQGWIDGPSHTDEKDAERLAAAERALSAGAPR